MTWTEITRKQYRRDHLRFASDLNDAEWLVLSFFLPPCCHVGRPREVSLRAVLDAILYILSTGCQWRALPPEFPSRSTVQYYFYLWRDQRLWRRINLALVRRAREAAGRNAVPSAGVIDSQSTKTTESGGPRGFDAAKKVKGRKRHIVTDTQGFPLAVLVHAQHPGQPRRRAAARLATANLPQAAICRRRSGLSRTQAAQGDCRIWPLEDRDRHAIRADRYLQARTQTLGDRTHLRMARTQPPPCQGLRAHHRQRRSLVPHRQRPPSLPASRKSLRMPIEF